MNQVPVIDWVFRSRRTGRIAIVQVPNVALALAFAMALLRRLLDLSGSLSTAFLVAGTVALLYWAGDEVIRGVNPWRRFLGGGVLVWQVVSLVPR